MDSKYNFFKPIKNPNLIRLGRNEDGGYIIDERIVKNNNYLVTFGMGPDWSFELDYIKRNPDVKIFMYDYTVSSVPYIKQVLKYFKRFITFRGKYEYVKNRINYLLKYLSFFKLKNVSFFSEKITFPIKNKIDTDIDKVFSRIPKDVNIVLKSDIEGSEFEVIDEINKYSSRIELMIFEFHWLDKNENLFLKAIEKFKKNFHVVHIHGNNHCEKLPSGLPITLEMTLINKKYHIEIDKYITDFPVKNLDFPNNPTKNDLTFSFKD